ncbi:MAG TPA: hypothetical protein PKL65_04575 [Bacteroidales bacterium]|jgi:hypothetical protein|nr:hypothetical protein [Bacteroidales bacterium]HPM17476.1 hypothetical protein [Bacteroidales bacterium]HQG75930.1 hypothetical protein [Bacteroidales bacterium]
MKIHFEHHTQKVLPFSRFLLRLGKYFVFSSVLIAFSLVLGMAGYHFAGRLNLLDSFHMACMILTGMGPVVELTSPGAKIFSSLYALYSGIAFLSITAVFLSPIIHRILHILHVESENRAR